MIIKETLSYEKVELYDTETTDSIAENYTSIIRNLGEDVNREGILSTPVRAESNAVFNSWIWTRPLEILKSALFTEDHRQMIVVKDIEVYSMCEHHMLPFR
jgi:GTP cyclohydrolase I